MFAPVQDLRALVDAYAVAADDRDGAAFGALFTDDACLIVGDHRYDGRTSISSVPGRLSKYRRTLHLVSTHRVHVDGDRATGTAYCEAHHVDDDADRVLYIRYDDEYARGADAGWRFAVRAVHVLWEERRPVAERPEQ